LWDDVEEDKGEMHQSQDSEGVGCLEDVYYFWVSDFKISQ
jgi:hypothetical protein